MTSKYYIYIASNRSKLIYVGLTHDVDNILHKHRHMNMNCSRGNFGLNKLIYVEEFRDVEEAIVREKELKNSSRLFKTRLVTSFNPKWECIQGCWSKGIEKVSSE